MGAIRKFSTGATRDTDENKPDYESYLSPIVIARYGEYMLEHQRQPDGSIRAGDNWAKGIPRREYVKSMWRHFLDVWLWIRDFPEKMREEIEDALCAIIFNASGLLHEILIGRDAEELEDIERNRRVFEDIFRAEGPVADGFWTRDPLYEGPGEDEDDERW